MQRRLNIVRNGEPLPNPAPADARLGAASLVRYGTAALACLCVAATLLAAVLHFLELKGDVALLFHSDTDYLPALYRDLFEQGGRLSQWNLTPAPSFFPDWPLFFLANWLTGDFFHALPAFFVMQGAMLFALSLVLGRTAVDDGNGKAAVAAAWACVLVFCWAMHNIVPYSYFYLSAFHCGAFLLLLLSLRLQQSQDRPAMLWLLGAMAMLAALSDRLYVLQYSLPVVATLACLHWRRGLPWKKLCAVILLGSVIGIRLYKAKWLVAHPLQLPWGMSLHAVPGNLALLADMLAETWRPMPLGASMLLAYYAVVTVLLPGTLLGRGWRIAHPVVAMLAVFSWFSAAACLAAVLVSTNVFTVRYFIPAYVLPLVIGPLLLYGLLPQRLHRYLTLLLLAAGVWLTQSMLVPAARDIGAVQQAYYPQEVACMDGVIAQYGLRRGMATYWDAKRIGMLSRHQPVIAPYTPELEAFHWITSETVFGGAYDFALVRHVEGLDAARLIRENGASAARVDCGIFEVLAFPGGGLKRGFVLRPLPLTPPPKK